MNFPWPLVDVQVLYNRLTRTAETSNLDPLNWSSDDVESLLYSVTFTQFL